MDLEALVRSWDERADTAEALGASGALGRVQVEVRQVARTYRACAAELRLLLTEEGEAL